MKIKGPSSDRHPAASNSADVIVENSHGKAALTQSDLLSVYRVAEFVTLARDGSPICWPLAPDLESGRLVFSTGYVYLTKARNAQRNPRVAALYSDPTASGRSETDPLVLVQGLADVFDQDLQRNTERYVDQLLQKGPIHYRLMVRMPGLRQLLVGYLARIWIEVLPQQEYVWQRGQAPPTPLNTAIHPDRFTPGPGVEIPLEVFQWLPRYQRPPVLAYIDQAGWPAMTRVDAEVKRDLIEIGSGVQACEGAPACLTYHRLIGNYHANDSFLIRGHFNRAGQLVPEKVLGFVGTNDDRGMGTIKVMRLLLGYRKQLAHQLGKEGRPLPTVRASK